MNYLISSSAFFLITSTADDARDVFRLWYSHFYSRWSSCSLIKLTILPFSCSVFVRMHVCTLKVQCPGPTVVDQCKPPDVSGGTKLQSSTRAASVVTTMLVISSALEDMILNMQKYSLLQGVYSKSAILLKCRRKK